MKNKKKTIFLPFYTALFFIYIFLPIIIIFIFAWNNNEGYNFPLSGFTWKWFLQFFQDSIAKKAMLNSFLIAFLSSTISTIFGTALAFGITNSNLRHKGAYLGLLMLPVLMPSLTIAISALVFFRTLSVPSGMPLVIFAHVSISMSYVVLIMLGRIEDFSGDIQEASIDLGASWASSIKDVVFPLLSPAMLAAWVFAFMLSWNEFIVTYFLIGNNITIPVYIFSQLRFGISPKVNVISVLVTGFTLIMIVLYILIKASVNRLKSLKMPGV